MNHVNRKQMKTANNESRDADASMRYDPTLLLNALLQRMSLRGDDELAGRLRMDRKLLGGIREGRLQISGSMLMLIGEATGLGVDELRRILHDRRRSSRMLHEPNRRK
jgi:hypothetical protein